MSHAAGASPLPRFAIFTDFDGTLVDLAETPDGITIPDDLPAELTAAAINLDGAIAVISGRPLAELERYLPDGVPAAGSHGTERRLADGSLIPVDPAWTATAARLAAHLAPLLLKHPALLLEQKPAAVALHYRQAPELEAICLSAVGAAVAQEPGFDVLKGKMVVEARPRGTSKADAMRAFMREAPFSGRVPVFFGDDTTDEDGFLAAQNMGGVGVKVGEGETIARVRAVDVKRAREIMSELARRVAESAVRS